MYIAEKKVKEAGAAKDKSYDSIYIHEDNKVYSLFKK